MRQIATWTTLTRDAAHARVASNLADLRPLRFPSLDLRTAVQCRTRGGDFKAQIHNQRIPAINVGKTRAHEAGVRSRNNALAVAEEDIAIGKRDVHTGKDTEGNGWVNKVARRVESTSRTQEAAADAGRRMAKQLKADHVIHGRDGSIREERQLRPRP